MNLTTEVDENCLEKKLLNFSCLVGLFSKGGSRIENDDPN